MRDDRESSPSVVIVEPDVDNALLYDVVLEEYFTVWHAPASEALEATLATRPRAVVTELAVPGFDAPAFCARVREAHAGCVVLGVTGRVERIAPAFEAGCHSVLVKPFNVHSLLRRLLSLTRRHDGSRVLRRPANAPCPRCDAPHSEVFDHRWGGGVWLVCRTCGNVWVETRSARSRRRREPLQG